MSYNGVIERGRLQTILHSASDAGLFFIAFSLGTFLRLGAEGWGEKYTVYLPGIISGSFLFGCATYISGLYSGHHGRQRLAHAIRLAAAFGVATVAMLGVFYLFASTPVGRGVLLISIFLAYSASLVHHFSFIRPKQSVRERVAILVAGPSDEQQAVDLSTQWRKHVDFRGVIHYEGYSPRDPFLVLGSVADINTIVRREGIQRILCTDDTINDPAMCRHLCAARYSGISVTPLVALCEEIYQCVPLELVRPEWLLQASSHPHFLYISKIKRAFDILVSLALMVMSAPLLLAAMAAVRLTSRGPVFYRQTRVGRFGREFTVIKLRTMRVDAEAGGAVWASVKDPRQTRVGGLLRKYRIDEIPQLLNILKGEMSFVGPRPERPEFSAMLSECIPFYAERLMVHPGLTGWAQVNYPYGASMQDSRRKLEYDLYYMKHMSLFLDLFVLLDTVRTVLLGGARPLPAPLRFRVMSPLLSPVEKEPEPARAPRPESIYAG